MTIKTACPKCTHVLQVVDDNAGKSVCCPMCQEVFQAGALAEVVPEVAQVAIAPAGILEAPTVVRTAADYVEPTPLPPSVQRDERERRARPDRQDDAQRRSVRQSAAGWSAAAIWLCILVPVAILGLAGATLLLLLWTNVRSLEAQAREAEAQAQEAFLEARQEADLAKQHAAAAEEQRAQLDKEVGKVAADPARREIEDLRLTNKHLEQELAAARQRIVALEAALAKRPK